MHALAIFCRWCRESAKSCPNQGSGKFLTAAVPTGVAIASATWRRDEHPRDVYGNCIDLSCGGRYRGTRSMEENIPGAKRRRNPGSSRNVHATSDVAHEISVAGTKSTRRRKEPGVLDVKTLLADGGLRPTVRRYRKNDVILLQGEPAGALFCVQDGTVKLSILSRQGNEATIALLGVGEFFGEGCVTTDRVLSMETATALADCCVLRIRRRNVLQVLHRMHPLLAALISFLITRNRRVQEDLADQLFNSAEKRLARTLLLLAGLDKGGKTEGVIPNVSQQVLAEMIGVTRQRVNFFMNRFRKLGFIEYDHDIKVRQSLRTVLLHD